MTRNEHTLSPGFQSKPLGLELANTFGVKTGILSPLHYVLGETQQNRKRQVEAWQFQTKRQVQLWQVRAQVLAVSQPVKIPTAAPSPSATPTDCQGCRLIK
jgi:hypothetical protein